MNWLKPKEPSSKPHPLCHALNSLQTQISNIVRTVPDRFFSPVPNRFSSPVPNRFASISSSSSENSPPNNGGVAADDYALSAEEIKKRMAGIPVYKVSNDSQSSRLCGVSQYGDRAIQFYFLNKPDALDFTEIISSTPDSRIVDAPLTEVVDFEGGEIAPIRLIPELSEVKNALQVRKKHTAGFPDTTFGGVPVFQSDRLIVKGKGDSHKYRPAFLRKKDLEKALAKTKAPNKRGNIQVAALEDIIQEMKDCSTSKWNDVVFVAPGNNMDLDMALEEER